MNNRTSLSEQVYQQLLKRLASRKLKPGQVITRRGMAEELGVSMAPVAEAFARLERDGLLQTIPRRGTRVRQFTLDDARNQAVVRLALETQTARMTCGATLAAQSTRLRKCAERVDGYRKHTAARMQADIKFHMALAELTQSPLLCQTLESVMQLGFFIAHQLVEKSFAKSHPISRHMVLLKRLQCDTPDQAAAAMREHLMHGSVGKLLADSVM